MLAILIFAVVAVDPDSPQDSGRILYEKQKRRRANVDTIAEAEGCHLEASSSGDPWCCGQASASGDQWGNAQAEEKATATATTHDAVTISGAQPSAAYGIVAEPHTGHVTAL